MHIVVTGASSFLGAHLVRHFLELGHKVTATCRKPNSTTARLRLKFPGPSLRLVNLDIAQRADYATLPPTTDAVIHVAGLSTAEGVSQDDMLACNVDGSRHIIKHALDTGASKFIYTSTLSVHGAISDNVVDETTPVRNPDVYGASKYLAERMLAAVADHLPGIAVRLPGVLGAGAHRAWLPVVLEKLRINQDVTVYNADAPFNNAAHVDDLGNFFAQLLDHDWKSFFAFPVGAADSIAVRGAVERLRAAMSSSSKIDTDPAIRPGFTISSERAMDFGYRPMPIHVMLDRYVQESGLARGSDVMGGAGAT